jgi:hypothetical protein
MVGAGVIKKYINISLLNLLIVAAVGVLMRFKIGFEFPYFDQKYLQHAHSHFAFAGWITHTLFVFIVSILSHELQSLSLSKYLLIIKLNLICAYGMLISFALQGYDTASILFSSCSILLSFAFGGFYFYDTLRSKINFKGHSWFTAALAFAILSSAGTFMLAYMMSTKELTLDLYLSSVYYYLHFQYNGWFFFACMGLFIWKLNSVVPAVNIPSTVFKLFTAACIPAFFLSVLWLNIPSWLYLLVIVAAACQVMGFTIFLVHLKRGMPQIKRIISSFLQLLFLFAVIAVSIKLLLQLFSTIPEISKLAFGFRTIIIAYLHLVLLAFISVFLLAFMFWQSVITTSKTSIAAMVIIAAGIFLNELILLIQGLASFTYTPVPFANEGLFAVSILIFSGILLLLISNFRLNKPVG